MAAYYDLIKYKQAPENSLCGCQGASQLNNRAFVTQAIVVYGRDADGLLYRFEATHMVVKVGRSNIRQNNFLFNLCAHNTNATFETMEIVPLLTINRFPYRVLADHEADMPYFTYPLGSTGLTSGSRRIYTRQDLWEFLARSLKRYRTQPFLDAGSIMFPDQMQLVAIALHKAFRERQYFVQEFLSLVFSGVDDSNSNSFLPKEEWKSLALSLAGAMDDEGMRQLLLGRWWPTNTTGPSAFPYMDDRIGDWLADVPQRAQTQNWPGGRKEAALYINEMRRRGGPPEAFPDSGEWRSAQFVDDLGPDPAPSASR